MNMLFISGRGMERGHKGYFGWSSWHWRSFILCYSFKINSGWFWTGNWRITQPLFLEKSQSCIFLDKFSEATQHHYLVHAPHHDHHLCLVLGYHGKTCQGQEHFRIFLSKILDLFFWCLLCYLSQKVCHLSLVSILKNSYQVECYSCHHLCQDCLHHHLALWLPPLLALEGWPDLQSLSCWTRIAIQLSWGVN